MDVQVFLRQAGTPCGGEVNILGGSGAVGMTGTGVRLTFPTGPNDAQVLSTADIFGNDAFDNFGFGPFTDANGGVTLMSQATSGTPVLGTAVGPDAYDLFLGTYRFTAGSVIGPVTPVTASIPLFPNSNDNVAATDPFPTVLLNIVDGSTNITVASGGGEPNPVPVPNSAVLCLTRGAVLAGRFWRLRKTRTNLTAG